MTSLHHKMGRLPVKRVAHRMQLLQFGERICHMQQRTISVVTRTFKKHSGRNIQVHNPACVMQTFSIIGVKYDPAPCSHDYVARLGKFVDCLYLPSPKAILPLYLKNGRDRNTCACDDFMIRVIKGASQALRQLATDRCFAGPH